MNDAGQARERMVQGQVAARGPDAKAVVWAHNSHIGDARATEMVWRGELTIGQLCKERFGRDAYAIGVIYRPEAERWSHYFDAVLPRQFDAFAWFAETTSVTPLAASHVEHMPDTYPFGL